MGCPLVVTQQLVIRDHWYVEQGEDSYLWLTSVIELEEEFPGYLLLLEKLRCSVSLGQVRMGTKRTREVGREAER